MLDELPAVAGYTPIVDKPARSDDCDDVLFAPPDGDCNDAVMDVTSDCDARPECEWMEDTGCSMCPVHGPGIWGCDDDCDGIETWIHLWDRHDADADGLCVEDGEHDPDGEDTTAVEVHPHADPDGVLRDGDARLTFFRMRTEKAAPVDILAALYRRYNDRFFDGVLSRPILLVAPRGADFVGRYRCPPDAPRPVIIVRDDMLDGYESVRDTLLHEMCHQHVREVQGDHDEESHGPKWRALAERCGVGVDREGGPPWA